MSAPDHDGLVRCAECDGHGCAECGGLGEVLREGLNGEPKAPKGATQALLSVAKCSLRASVEQVKTVTISPPEALALLADRDRIAAQAKTLARALLAWIRLGDRGFGEPADWDCYAYRGWKLDMGGCEEFFDTEFEAQAVKTACMNAHGLADIVIREANS